MCHFNSNKLATCHTPKSENSIKISSWYLEHSNYAQAIHLDDSYGLTNDQWDTLDKAGGRGIFLLYTDQCLSPH